ncbi:uncharacterized protein LOC132639995 [Lycium barbarum]|uniref:uncharacterized protein LOC132639995 n=1 Tax=Lycium barbarum TaxID=112863 RepID=UPI00293E91CA|nr:uncharacterized protein LOC132639995 [Lycium barbarum]
MSGRKDKTSEVCQKLKEIHPWADDTLIVDVMAGVNDFSTALTLLEAMVSPDNGFDIDKPLSGWAAFDLNERLKQQDIEPEPERETFPHLSVPATSLSDPSQSIGAMLEKPFPSMLVPSVSSPSLMANKGSDANLIQVGNSRLSQSDGFIKERDFHEVCQKLKEIHPWADDTLIVDVMASVNDFSMALTLLEAMVSPDNGFDIDKSLTGWAAFDLNERLKQQDIEPEPERETFPHLSVPATSLSDPSQSIGAMLEKPFPSMLVPSVSSPSLMANKGSDANLIQVGNSRLSQSDGFIKERDFHEVCQKLKEIHPWADDTLIVDVMSSVNDFSMALTLLEAMVSPDNGFDIDKSLTGWAAFDLNERLKQQDIEPEPERETFPHLSVPATSLSDPSQSIGAMLEKPFPSMLVPSVSSPSLMANKGSDANLILVGNSRLSQSDGFIKERDFHEVCQKLKEIHPWADDTLIVDVMSGVNDFSTALTFVMSGVNDFSTALTLLEAMVSPDNGFDIDKSLTPKEADTPSMQKLREVDTDTEGVKSSNKDSFTTTSKFAATDSMNLDELSDALAKCLQSNSRELMSNCVSHENKLHFDGAMGSMMFVPVEPEWEEDDIYSIHRKDAMKMTRSAAQHSKAASEAYRRGDHVSAQHFSLKAKEERVVANRLNSQAAKKILIARNCKNDQWTLDLHGLHATEAVQALQEHLQKIESQMTQNRAVHVNQVNLFESTGRNVNLFESAGHNVNLFESAGHNVNLFASLLNKQRPAFLEVITGKGIHSRGQPALPTFIRSFLMENGYHYEERRPGVITVRPKLRPR